MYKFFSFKIHIPEVSLDRQAVLLKNIVLSLILTSFSIGACGCFDVYRERAFQEDETHIFTVLARPEPTALSIGFLWIGTDRYIPRYLGRYVPIVVHCPRSIYGTSITCVGMYVCMYVCMHVYR